MDREYVFIVTYGRSGSTALMRVLNSLEGYHIKGENWNTLFGLYRSYQQINHAKLKKGMTIRSGEHPWYGAERLDPDRYAQKLADVFVEEVIQPPEDAKVIGFKEIRYFQTWNEFDPFLTFMKRFFKPAKFIFNSRPIDQVLQSQWWATMDEVKVRHGLNQMDERFAEYASDFPDHAIHMNHKNWTRNPDAFEPLMTFLGQPFDRDTISGILGEHLSH